MLTAFSTQKRCNGCGIRITTDVGVCPGCQSDLAQVGIWSEYREWGEIRQLGRGRFVWRFGVLMLGGIMALGFSLGAYVQGDKDPVDYLVIVTFSLAGGYLWGRRYWHSAERQYEAAEPLSGKTL